MDVTAPAKPKHNRVAKEFEIQGNCSVSAGSDALAAAYTACLGGKHAPVNPHRQRLLVAANKEAKAVKKGGDKAKKAGGTGANTKKPTDSNPQPAKDNPLPTANMDTTAAPAAAPAEGEGDPVRTPICIQCALLSQHPARTLFASSAHS